MPDMTDSEMIDLGKSHDMPMPMDTMGNKIDKKCYPSLWIRGIELPKLPPNAEGTATIKFKKVMQRWGDKPENGEAEFEVTAIKFDDAEEGESAEEDMESNDESYENDNPKDSAGKVVDVIAINVRKKTGKKNEAEMEE